MTFKIEITGSGHELQGVGRLPDGRAVFVPGALPGELVTVRIVKQAKNYAIAEPTDILRPSTERVTPDCPRYGLCGGCQSLHMNAQYALQRKAKRVFDALTRIGGISDPEMLDAVPCVRMRDIRNKAEYAIGKTAAGDIDIGAFRLGTHEVIPLRACKMQSEVSNALLRAFADLLPKMRNSEALAYLVTRTNRRGEMMAVLSGRTPSLVKEKGLFQAFKAAVPALKSLYYCHLHPRYAHALHGPCRLIGRDSEFTDTLNGLEFVLSPESFFQVNADQAEKLYDIALDAAMDGLDNPNLLDLYCGVGTIGLTAASRGAEVTGMEIVPPAIQNALENARRNGLQAKSRFFCGDASTLLAEFTPARPFDAVLLDPPRKGAEPDALKAIIALSPKRIVYVSCDPGTLARDVRILTEAGYRFDWARPVDMFPGTYHVETVVLMSRIQD